MSKVLCRDAELIEVAQGLPAAARLLVELGQLIRNPSVELNVQGDKLSCVAQQVSDEARRRQILTLRDSPPQLNRVVFEIKPHE